MACELPAERGVPLSRWSSAELAIEAVKRGIVATIAAVTIWRWLREDAIRPWNYRSWIFPRDPQFAEKAGRILDLYEGRWDGKLLEPGDYVVCCDEKPSIQARARIHASEPAKPHGDGQRVEHEYERRGALCYFAAWDVRRAKLFDRCDEKDGIVPFDKLIEQFMTQEPYRSAKRVFVIVDNGSAHRGKRSINRLQGRYKNLILVHTPGARELGQPGPRSTSRSRSARRCNPTTSPISTRSSGRSWRSVAAMRRSPDRSSGSSPARISIASWTALTSPLPRSSRPRDPTNASTYLRRRPLSKCSSQCRVGRPGGSLGR